MEVATTILHSVNFMLYLIYFFIIILSACLEPLGLGNFQIPDASLTSSTSRSWLWEKRVRLGFHKREMWCSKYRDLNQFVKVF